MTNSKQLIEKIMQVNVPEKSDGFLTNPLANKKNKHAKINRKSNTTKTHLIEVFSDQYLKSFGAIYRMSALSDSSSILKIIDFFEKNKSQDVSGDSEKFILWCFKIKDKIYKEQKSFTTISVLKYLNTFYQQYIFIPQDNEQSMAIPSENLLKEIKSAENKGNATSVFVKFGIPVSFTYYVRHQKNKPSSVEKGLRDLIEKLSKTPSGQKNLKEMFKHSILNSPYPQWFEFLDWREKLDKYVFLCKNDLWWRDIDYVGSDQVQYNILNDRP